MRPASPRLWPLCLLAFIRGTGSIDCFRDNFLRKDQDTILHKRCRAWLGEHGLANDTAARDRNMYLLRIFHVYRMRGLRRLVESAVPLDDACDH